MRKKKGLFRTRQKEKRGNRVGLVSPQAFALEREETAVAKWRTEGRGQLLIFMEGREKKGRRESRSKSKKKEGTFSFIP